MARLIDIPFKQLKETISILDAAGWTCDDFDELRRPGRAAAALEAVRNAMERQSAPGEGAPAPATEPPPAPAPEVADLPAPPSAGPADHGTIEVPPSVRDSERPPTRPTARVKRVPQVDSRFIPPAAQIEQVRRWNAERGWGFTDGELAALTIAPRAPKEDLAAVVIEICLPEKDEVPAVNRTFAELCAVIGDQHKLSMQVRSDPQSIMLQPGAEHMPGLRWRIIRLAANWNREEGTPFSAGPGLRTAPHAAGLSAAALFPGWLSAMDGTATPHVCVAGYRTRDSADEPWDRVVVIERLAIGEKMWIHAETTDKRDKHIAIPELLV